MLTCAHGSLCLRRATHARHHTCRSKPAAAAETGPEITQKVYLDVKVGHQPPERLVLGLYGKDVPRTAANFAALATGEQGFGYKGTIFHRVIKVLTKPLAVCWALKSLLHIPTAAADCDE